MLVVNKRLRDLSSCLASFFFFLFLLIYLAPKELQTNQAAVPVAFGLKTWWNALLFTGGFESTA